MTAEVRNELHVLSAGAAQSLVAALTSRFSADAGVRVCATFGAVGAMRERLLAGARCDVLILTEPMIGELAISGHVDASTRAAIGRVWTGIGVRAGDLRPNIANRAALESSLRAASDIFLPDPERATAGIHFARILKALGIHADVAPQLRPHPNGAAAMRALAQSDGLRPIGCTQISEILCAEGVELVGPLPQEFELATTYSIALCVNTRQPEAARLFSTMLCAPDMESLRAKAGFEG